MPRPPAAAASASALAAGRAQSVGEPRIAVAGFGLLAGEEGEDGSGILARPHRLFRPSREASIPRASPGLAFRKRA